MDVQVDAYPKGCHPSQCWRGLAWDAPRSSLTGRDLVNSFREVVVTFWSDFFAQEATPKRFNDLESSNTHTYTQNWPLMEGCEIRNPGEQHELGRPVGSVAGSRTNLWSVRKWSVSLIQRDD